MENYIASVLSPLCQARAHGRKGPGSLPRAGVRMMPCDLCGLTFDPGSLYQLGGLCLCGACRDLYSDACYSAFSSDFIEENADCFYSGWFEGLDPREQTDLLRRAYRAAYRRATPVQRAGMRSERREFCSCAVNERWPEYVARRIAGAYNNILH